MAPPALACEPCAMDIYEALYTTRAMRRVRPDPIPEAVQARILDAAIRAPTGGNAQAWRFMLIDDAEIKARLGPLYRESLGQLFETIYKPRLDAATADPQDPESVDFMKMYRSANHLAEHFEGYPLLLVAFTRFDPSGGSIFPAVWSAMLAARAEGVGSALTSVLMFKADAVLEILEVPSEQGWTLSGLVTMGYPTGRWGVAPRKPVATVACRNGWHGALGLDVALPLWPGES
jgi:nitroreductase